LGAQISARQWAIPDNDALAHERYVRMTIVKTAISLPESLLERVDELARELKVSRSRVFVMALDSFVRDYQDRRLFEKINEAYRDEPETAAEQSRLQEIRRQHGYFAEGEW
jgi:metal-responsive CopG/Arc/MetJ family transcriptional regulator